MKCVCVLKLEVVLKRKILKSNKQKGVFLDSLTFGFEMFNLELKCVLRGFLLNNLLLVGEFVL